MYPPMEIINDMSYYINLYIGLIAGNKYKRELHLHYCTYIEKMKYNIANILSRTKENRKYLCGGGIINKNFNINKSPKSISPHLARDCFHEQQMMMTVGKIS